MRKESEERKRKKAANWKRWSATHDRTEYHRKYYDAHLEKVRRVAREYWRKNHDHKVEYDRIYNKNNLEKRAIYRRRKYATDINFSIADCLRSRINRAVRVGRAGSAIRDLGCSLDELRSYLESKFLTGMTWNNRGRDGWHIDHVIPLAYFDLTDREQFLKACHYTNLQPMWAIDNYKKHARLVTILH